MSNTVYSFKRGGTIVVYLDDYDDISASVQDVYMDLRKLDDNNDEPLPHEPVAASFVVTSRAAAPPIDKGWTGTIAPADSLLVPKGRYQVDARIVFTADVDERITQGPEIEILEPATLRPSA